MSTSAVAGALAKQTPAQTPAQPTGTDAQNAAVLASIAAPTASAAQNQQAASAVSSRLGALDHAAPQAFAQQQQASAQAPYQLAANIAGQERAGTGAYNGAMSAGTGDYLSQISATMPLVNALVSAQIAKANNDYALSQQTNGYDQADLALKNRTLDYQNKALDQSQSNPILYGSAQQKSAAQAQIAQAAQSDSSLTDDDKQALISTVGSPSVYDYASALNTYNTTKAANPKSKLNDQRIMQYLNSYFSGASTPSAAAPAAVAATQPASSEQSPQAQALQGFQQSFSPSNIAYGAKQGVKAEVSLARKLLGF